MHTHERSFDDLYQRLAPFVRARCRRMLGSSNAEDIVQETFVRFWASGVSSTPHTPAQIAIACRWLHRTCTRLSIDALRSQRWRGKLPPLSMSMCDTHEVVAARAALLSLRDEVPESELEVVVLARVDGLAQPEVARILGVSERTVRRSLARFDQRTRALREEIGQSRLPVLALAFALALAALFTGRSCSAETGEPAASEQP